MEKLLESLSNLPCNTPLTLFLFALPQILVDNEVVVDHIKDLLKKKLLHLVAYDEIHLFREFGRSFRKEFRLLQNICLTPVCSLLMTAMCNKTIVISIKKFMFKSE